MEKNHHLPKLILKRSTWIIALLLIAWMLFRLQVELLWFSQFGWQSIIIRRFVIQLIGLVISSGFIIICHKWQSRWKVLKSNEIKDQIAKPLVGTKYGLSLITSLLAIAITVAILLQITWTSLLNPLSLEKLWSNELILNIIRFLPISVVILLVILVLNVSRSKDIIQFIASILFITVSTRSWGLWSLAIAIPPSGIREPLHGADISFALAKFPALCLGLGVITIYLILTLANSFWFYLTKDSRVSDWSSPELTREQKNHLKPLCSLIALSGASLIWISRHQLLWEGNGIVPGAGWLDVHLILPLRTLSAICILIFSISLITPKYRRLRRVARFSSIILGLFSVFFELTLGPLLQWMLVKPRELYLESKYIERSISATRSAFQLDSISTRFIKPRSRLTKKDLVTGEGTLRNIRLWDSKPLLATNSQLQQLRVYYRFSGAAVDRYSLRPNSPERQQVIISAREIDHESLPETSRTWLNRHFVFTHGYGFTLSPVNTKAKDGLPDYFIKDIGNSIKVEGKKSLAITRSDVKNAIPIGRSAIYYGRITAPYAVAPSKIEELDYPEGDQNIFNHYEGSGGVRLMNPLERIAAAIYLVEPRLLNTGSLTKDSKLLLRREVKKRVKAIAPFRQ